jgi:hypothetical protein
MAIWKFLVNDKDVSYGNRTRKTLTNEGCNEPYKDRYWCPKKKWFTGEACPFINRHECENFTWMSGERLAKL